MILIQTIHLCSHLRRGRRSDPVQRWSVDHVRPGSHRAGPVRYPTQRILLPIGAEHKIPSEAPVSIVVQDNRRQRRWQQQLQAGTQTDTERLSRYGFRCRNFSHHHPPNPVMILWVAHVLYRCLLVVASDAWCLVHKTNIIKTNECVENWSQRFQIVPFYIFSVVFQNIRIAEPETYFSSVGFCVTKKKWKKIRKLRNATNDFSARFSSSVVSSERVLRKVEGTASCKVLF